jgi:hypothetical protein
VIGFNHAVQVFDPSKHDNAHSTVAIIAP